MKKTTTYLFISLCFFACNAPEVEQSKNEQALQDSIDMANLNQTPGLGYEFRNNGKNRNASPLEELFTDTVLLNLEIAPSDDLNKALKGSAKYVRRKNRVYDLTKNISLSNAQIGETIEALEKWQTEGGELSDFVKMYQYRGEDSLGNVHFTGYYIPVLKVSKTKDETFKYPLYRKPSGSWSKLTRTEIDTEKKLEGKGYELAYSSDLLENFIMQVQGSGVVEYPDGSRKLFSYGGKNGQAYKSLGKYLVAQGHVPAENISLTAIRAWMAEHPDSLESLLNLNASYVYFKATDGLPSGAAGVPLVGQHSIAVDKNQIPLGSILLGEVPVLDENGYLTGHEFRILTAHDVGGAINEGHVDFFSGIGKIGEAKADALHHYGRIWLLVSKE